MKKEILYSIFITTILFSCKLNKKINSEKEFQIVETQMAEINPGPEIEILKEDTLEIVKFWEKFYTLYKQRDTAKVIDLSLDSIICPVYIEDYNWFPVGESRYVSITDFLNAPSKKNHSFKIIPYSKKEQFHIYIHYSYNKDTQNFGLKKDSVFLNYTIGLLSEEINGNYRILKEHLFSFIKINNSIKFSGLQIIEAGSRLLNDSTTRSNLYFPLYRKTQDSITNLSTLDTFANLWYSNSLSSFKEPYLYNYKGDVETYRFTWLRSFHNPIVIRFQKQGNDHILTTKEMIDYDGYIPDKIIVNTTQYLTASAWNKWELKISKIDFWSKQPNDPEPRGTDGAEWILEANIKGKYHFISRQSPYDEYRKCCEYLLFLSKLKIPEKAIY